MKSGLEGINCSWPRLLTMMIRRRKGYASNGSSSGLSPPLAPSRRTRGLGPSQRRLTKTQNSRSSPVLSAGGQHRYRGLGSASPDLLTSELDALRSAPRVRRFRETSQGDVVSIITPAGEEVVVDGSERNSSKARTIVALHTLTTGGSESLSLSEESDGSQRLLHLLPGALRSNNPRRRVRGRRA